MLVMMTGEGVRRGKAKQGSAHEGRWGGNIAGTWVKMRTFDWGMNTEDD